MEKKDRVHSLIISQLFDSKECCYLSFRTHFRGLRMNGSQTLLKPARRQFYPTFLLISAKLSSKTSPWVKSEILWLLFNTLTAHHMHSCQSWDKFTQQVLMHLSSKPFTLSQIFIAFFNSTKHFSRFEKNITFIAYIFWKLLTPKNLAIWILESYCFRTPFRSQRVSGSQTLMKPAPQHFYHIFLLISGKLSWKTSLLVTTEILKLFFNTLIAYHMHCRRY